MFNRWIRKKQHGAVQHAVDFILLLDDTEYAQFVVGTVNTADPATRAMSVVAIANETVFCQAAEEAGKRTGKPFKFDDALVAIHHRLDEVGDDPVYSRRFAWFMTAMHVLRMDRAAARNSSLIQQAVTVWLQLAESGRHICTLLEHNAVWRDEEKVWFEQIKTQDDGRNYVLTTMMPRAYRRHEHAQAFAKQHNILLLDEVDEALLRQDWGVDKESDAVAMADLVQKFRGRNQG